jgi:Alpha/beta hydrolase domain
MTGGSVRRFTTIVVACVVAAAGCSSSSHRSSTTSSSAPSPTPTTTRIAPPNSPVAVPTVTGPISGGTPDVPVNAMPTQYEKQFGYSEREYFFAGTATAYKPTGVWGEDGRWGVAPTTTAAYKSRMIVRTPTDPKKFNGTVVVEWLNQSAGRDSDPDFGFAHLELLRAGFAYVGVSAQALGITGQGGFSIPIPGYNPVSLKVQNPARYKSLSHPGDDYSYDIFSQAAQAIWRPKGVNPLGTLHPQRLIATGESQSAFHMVTYVNAIAPIANLYEGFMIHSRANNGTAIDSTSAAPKIAHIRTDLGRPVMTVETETDLFGLGFYQARQPDNAFLRTWEMAGTSHADQSTLDYGIASGHVWSPGEKAPDFTALCGVINDGPESLIVSAAFAALNTWVANGTPPAPAPPFQINAAGTAIARDARGNALGGIRTPAVDVPISALDGTLAPGKSVICSLFGSTTPFDAATLKALYPTHADYVGKVTTAANAAVAKTFVLPADAATMIAQAQAAPIPS